MKKHFGKSRAALFLLLLAALCTVFASCADGDTECIADAVEISGLLPSAPADKSMVKESGDDAVLDDRMAETEESAESTDNADIVRENENNAQTGDNKTETLPGTALEREADEPATYIINKNTKRFHYPSCSSVGSMKEENKETYEGTRTELVNMGYKPCGKCKP